MGAETSLPSSDISLRNRLRRGVKAGKQCPLREMYHFPALGECVFWLTFGMRNITGGLGSSRPGRWKDSREIRVESRGEKSASLCTYTFNGLRRLDDKNPVRETRHSVLRCHRGEASGYPSRRRSVYQRRRFRSLTSAPQFGNVGQDDRLVRASRSTADRWIRAAAARADELGAIPPGRHLSNHTLRHSYARHLLVNWIPINYLSCWMGHSSIQPPPIYLELVPDPTGSLAAGP